MPLRYTALVTLALWGAGCGAPSTPDTLIERWIAAARDGDARAFRAAFPSRDEVADLFECPTDLALDSRFDAANPDFAAWRNNPPTLRGTLRIASESVPVGAPVGGCTARRALELVRMDATVNEARTERTLRLRIVVFEGEHRILGY